MDIKKYKPLFMEFVRFGIVGLISFVVDFGVMQFVFKIIFRQPDINPNMLYSNIATAFGFLIGVTVNYILSVKFVFTAEHQKGKGRDHKSRLIFLITTTIGFFLTLGLVSLMTGALSWTQQLSKIIATAIVMIWNYSSRKVLIFK